VKTAVTVAQDKQALDVVVLDLRETGGFTDFFIICTGTNSRQIQAIADAIEDRLKSSGERPNVVEGRTQSEWILLDYFNFIVHVFSRDARAYYSLDRLWGHAVRHEFTDAEIRNH
jgi:ribosome-associated protein